MTQETRQFHARDLLSVTTGRLLTKPDNNGNGIGNLYKLLGWMTNDQPFTHQLPRFSEECKPWLLRWFPELAKVNEHLSTLDDHVQRLGPNKGCEEFFTAMLKLDLKEHYDVLKIPANDHEVKHPHDELVAMRGTDKGILVVKP